MPKFFFCERTSTIFASNPPPQKKLQCNISSGSELSSWLSVLEISVFVDQITETDIIKIVFVSQNDIKLFLYDQELASAHQAP